MNRCQFGQGLRGKQLQRNEVSQLHPIQGLPKERSQPPGALCLHPLPRVSSSHLIDRDGLEPLTPIQPQTTLPLPPSFSAGFIFCKISERVWLQRAGGSTGQWPGGSPRLCGRGRADAERSFCGTVVFSQIKPTAEGRFPSLYRRTEACQKKGWRRRGGKAKLPAQRCSEPLTPA